MVARISQTQKPKESMYPILRYLGFFGNSNSSIRFGQVYDYWVLGPLGKTVRLKGLEHDCAYHI